MSRPSRLLPVLLLLSAAAPAAADPCLDCHRTSTPAAVAQWQGSAHAASVGCADCHGEDHAAIEAGQARVEAKVCGRCHPQAFHQHLASKHGTGLHTGWGCTRSLPRRDPRECLFCHEEGSSLPASRVHCARFLKQSSEMGEIGCNRCHQVESSCATCHTNHLTDLTPARDPGVCARCHMGPDHPQWEMWQTSQHGTLWVSAGPAIGPDCQRCHMSQGTHDVSRGITVTPAGKPEAGERREQRRAEMEAVCVQCHAPAFARREFARADAVLSQSAELVAQAEALVWDLHDRGLLDPMPSHRPPHPLSGPVLVTDAQMLYEETSHIERLLFKMKKYDFAKTWKGAYHQNPAYTHWYGNAELKLDLVDIRAEASRLERAAAGMVGSSALPFDPEAELAALKKKFERGALSATDYAAARAKVLERAFVDGSEKRE